MAGGLPISPGPVPPLVASPFPSSSSSSSSPSLVALARQESRPPRTTRLARDGIRPAEDRTARHVPASPRALWPDIVALLRGVAVWPRAGLWHPASTTAAAATTADAVIARASPRSRGGRQTSWGHWRWRSSDGSPSFCVCVCVCVCICAWIWSRSSSNRGGCGSGSGSGSWGSWPHGPPAAALPATRRRQRQRRRQQ